MCLLDCISWPGGHSFGITNRIDCEYEYWSYSCGRNTRRPIRHRFAAVTASFRVRSDRTSVQAPHEKNPSAEESRTSHPFRALALRALRSRAQPPKGGERSDHKHRDPKSAIPSSSRPLETQPSKAREARTFLF